MPAKYDCVNTIKTWTD